MTESARVTFLRGLTAGINVGVNIVLACLILWGTLAIAGVVPDMPYWLSAAFAGLGVIRIVTLVESRIGKLEARIKQLERQFPAAERARLRREGTWIEESR